MDDFIRAKYNTQTTIFEMLRKEEKIMKKNCVTNYDWTNSNLAIDIAEKVCDAINGGEYEELSDAVIGEIDLEMIWTDNQWEILKYYCTPEDADLQYAYECLIDEVYSIIDYEEEDED